jgi:thioesterase domain-containing protein
LRKSVLVGCLVARYAKREAESKLLKLVGKSKPTVILDEKGVPIAWEVIKRLQDNVMKTYQPPRASVRGVLFRAGHQNEVIDGILGEDMGWAGVFDGGLKVIPISGDHLSMIRSSEHKRSLAEAIDEYLSQVRPNVTTIVTVLFLLT